MENPENTTDIGQVCTDEWIEASQTIRERFGLVSVYPPSNFRISHNDSGFSDFALGRFDKDALVINSGLPSVESLFPAIISKLCLQEALPAELLCEECKSDISYEFARQRISDESTRQQWESLWAKQSPFQQISTVMNYDPSNAYKWLHSVAGNKGLDIIVKELTHRAKNQMPITFEDYLSYFSMRVQRLVSHLDKTELKLVNHLLENPDHKFNGLSGAVGVSNEWLSRKIAELQKRGILRKFNRIPFSRVGIQMFHLIVKQNKDGGDPFPLLSECPFLYSYRNAISGSWSAVSTLCVPENPKSLRYLRFGFDRIAKAGFDTNLYHIHSSGVSTCFDYYTNGVWNLPWELLAVQLNRIVTDNLASAIPRIDTPESTSSFQLEDLDMGIFQCIRRGISSVSKIRAELKVGQHRVADRLRALKDEGLLVTSWEVHNIGLNEHVMVNVKDRDTALAISGWSRRLPRSIVSFSPDSELMLYAGLPMGGSYGFTSAINDISHKAQVSVLSPKTYGNWGFPSSLWDSKYQKWKCPEKELADWIQSLK